MKPVHIDIGGSEKETGNVDFASQQKDKRDLCDRHPRRSESHALPVICIVDDGACCQEHGNNNPVCEYDQRWPQRRRTQPPPTWPSEADCLRIRYFSKDCECRGI